MNSPNRNIDQDRSNFLKLIKTIIIQELHAIISSSDHKSWIAGLTRKDRRKIKDNNLKIAEIATDYFMNNDKHCSTDEVEVNNLFSQSIKEAIRHL